MIDNPERSSAGGWVCVTLLLAMVAGGFYRGSIVPMRERLAENQRRIAELSGNVEHAKKRIKETQEMERRASGARAELVRWNRQRAAASAMVWFPENLKGYFRRFGIVDAVTRLNTVRPEPELPGYQRSYWAVDLPIQDGTVEFGKVLMAVGELEQAEPHVRVLDFAVRRDSANPARRTAVINLSTLARR